MLDVGDRIAGFEVEAFVARGGMAYVYRARDLRLSRTVALKVMAPELAVDPGFRQRFTRESELAASIDHPNIIPIYAAGEENHLLYLVMRFVPGDHLGEVLRQRGRLDPPEVLSIFGQVAEALDAAHAHGLVHRDVKPANILLAGDGELSRRHAYLSDFGLTTKVSADGEMTSATQAGVLGTLKYVPPERITGAPTDHRADIYSFGCVLFEALAGQPPFVREDEHAWLYAHVTEPPPRLSDLRPDLPVALDGVLAAALAKSPADRYPNCRALMWDLRTALERAPMAAPGIDPYAPGGDPTNAIPTTFGSSASSAHSGPSGPSASSASSADSAHSAPSAAEWTPTPTPTGSTPPARNSTPTPIPNSTGGSSLPPAGPDPNFRPYQVSAPTSGPLPAQGRRPGGARRVLVPILIAVAAVVVVGALVAGLLWFRPWQAAVVTPPPNSTKPTNPTNPSNPSNPTNPAKPLPLPQAAAALPDDVFVWRHEVGKALKVDTASTDGEVTATLLDSRQIRAAMVTPDRRTVLYLQEVDEVQTLRAMAADGGAGKALFTDGTASCPRLGRPAMRADGTLVAVCYERANGPGKLNVMTLDGQVVRTLDQGWIGDPSISRDGSTVAYWLGQTLGRVGGQLKLARIDGGGVSTLLDGADGELADAAWSPTADVLAYRVWIGDDRWLMSVPVSDGKAGTPQQITPRRYFDQGISWSPDGSTIGFRRGSDQESELLMVDADGSNERVIAHNDGYSSSPSWTSR